jgi:endoglucanase
VNQVGYLPASCKEFTVVADSVSAGQAFAVIGQNNLEVFTGNLDNEVTDDSEISGEQVYRGNFTGFNGEGIFRIKTGGHTSYPFRIHSEVYDSLLYHSLRAFHLFRANEPLNDAVSGLFLTGGYPEDASLPDGLGNTLDVSGGWYNAGDFGKRVPPTVFACAHLLNLYDINPEYFILQNLTVPNDNNNLPDVLFQAKTGLEWLLKMQRADGAVYHKVSSDPHVAYGYQPKEDPHERSLEYTSAPAAADAAGFTAVAARAARVYAPFDSLFAEQCRRAAVKSWEWVQKNKGTGTKDDFYPDPQSWQQELWAKAELFMLTGNQSLLGSFYEELSYRPAAVPHWSQPHAMSMVQIHNFPGIPEVVKGKIKQYIEKLAVQLITSVAGSGYGSAVDKFSWGTGSNATAANAGAVFAYAHQLTGNNEWLQYASRQLDYLLGRNSLNFSFVTGFGENSCRNPYHWISKAFGIVPKGLLVGGAATSHGGEEGYLVDMTAAMFPPAKMYIDTINSPQFNETGIYAVSSLAYLTGYLALHNREMDVTGAPLTGKNKPGTLDISDRNYSLYCSNCSGKTEVSLFSITGQLLKKETVLPALSGLKITSYENMAGKSPVIIYRVADETGRVVSGKVKGELR